jgi:pyridoxamine 5'-phosphate oxidase
MMAIADLRRDYRARALTERDADPDAIDQFRRWLDEAVRAELLDATAMTLATVNADGTPDARVVLLKDVTADGFTFYTNYESTKAAQLAATPQACLVFFWAELERQVRVTGAVSRAAAATSDAYFASRPLDSRLGAWASPQSRVIPSRAVLESAMAETAARFAGGDVPRPTHWGGYVVAPSVVEFWQGRPNRLHDRLRYRRAADASSWTIERLAP